MGPVSIGVEVQRNTDGDTPSRRDPTAAFKGTALFNTFAKDGMSGRFVESF